MFISQGSRYCFSCLIGSAKHNAYIPNGKPRNLRASVVLENTTPSFSLLVNQDAFSKRGLMYSLAPVRRTVRPAASWCSTMFSKASAVEVDIEEVTKTEDQRICMYLPHGIFVRFAVEIGQFSGKAIHGHITLSGIFVRV